MTLVITNGNRGGKKAWKSKYKAQAVTVDGERFDSQREYQRWCVLKLRERAKEISGLSRQIPFQLNVNGQPICKYVADFTYMENGKLIVGDAKGVRTDTYKIKKKLMKAIFDVDILET